VALDFHFAASHRVAAHKAGLGGDVAAARQAEMIPQMFFFRSAGRKVLHALRHLDDTFPALATFPAGSWHSESDRFRAIEQGGPRRDRLALIIDMKFNHHRVDSINAELQAKREPFWTHFGLQRQSEATTVL
jgi:hypothetical protein